MTLHNSTTMTLHICPKCSGQGHVLMPPWVAGDQLTYSTADVKTYDCPACGGSGILWEPSKSPTEGRAMTCEYSPNGNHEMFVAVNSTYTEPQKSQCKFCHYRFVYDLKSSLYVKEEEYRR